MKVIFNAKSNNEQYYYPAFDCGGIIEIPEDVEDADEYIDQFLVEYCELDSVDFEDFLRDAYSYDSEIEPKGLFELDKLYGVVLSNALNYIDKSEYDTIIKFDVYKNDNEYMYTRHIDVRDQLQYMITDEIDNDWLYKASTYIEYSLTKFLEESDWHIEAKSGEGGMPILWYGPKGGFPDNCWIIDANTDMNLESFFEEESYDIMKKIGLEDDLITVYLAECGCTYPEMEKVRMKCPIELSIDDDANTICKKIAELQRGMI